MKKTIMLTAICGLLQLANTSAAVTFLGTDGSLDFDAASGDFTKDSIQVTLAANNGTVNATVSGLGINAVGGGDTTNGIGTENVVEILTISFDVDVVFNSITLSSVGTNDALDASFNGGGASALTSSGLHSFGTTLLAGETLVLTATEPNAPTSNNGVTITQFTVTAVPEPSSFVLFGLGGLATLLRRRR